MEPVAATEAAEAAAEALRTLNHLTLRPPAPGAPGCEDLADVYAVVGSLRSLTERLPQALSQAAAAFEVQTAAYRTDDGSDPTVVVRYAAQELRQTAEEIDTARRRMTVAHNLASHLYVADRVEVIDGDALGE